MFDSNYFVAVFHILQISVPNVSFRHNKGLLADQKKKGGGGKSRLRGGSMAAIHFIQSNGIE